MTEPSEYLPVEDLRTVTVRQWFRMNRRISDGVVGWDMTLDVILVTLQRIMASQEDITRRARDERAFTVAILLTGTDCPITADDEHVIETLRKLHRDRLANRESLLQMASTHVLMLAGHYPGAIIQQARELSWDQAAAILPDLAKRSAGDAIGSNRPEPSGGRTE